LLIQSLKQNFCLQKNNKVYLNNPSSVILIFAIYVTYHKPIQIKDLKKFQPITDWVYSISDSKVKAYNVKTTEEKQFEMPIPDFLNFRLEMGILMLQTEKSIILYSSE